VQLLLCLALINSLEKWWPQEVRWVYKLTKYCFVFFQSVICRSLASEGLRPPDHCLGFGPGDHWGLPNPRSPLLSLLSAELCRRYHKETFSNFTTEVFFCTRAIFLNSEGNEFNKRSATNGPLIRSNAHSIARSCCYAVGLFAEHLSGFWATVTSNGSTYAMGPLSQLVCLFL